MGRALLEGKVIQIADACCLKKLVQFTVTQLADTMFFGRMCRCGADSVASFAASAVGDDWTAAFTPSVVRRPGIAGSSGSRPMTQSWRGQ
jgi:hypothetical protein